MSFKNETGRIGEQKAAVYLEDKGYKILERNFRSKLGEIDIVARDRDVVCFIEVRTRRGPGKKEEALSSVNGLKQYRLSKLAVSFLKNNNLWGAKARFDVVTVLLEDAPDGIFLLKDAFPVVAKYS